MFEAFYMLMCEKIQLLLFEVFLRGLIFGINPLFCFSYTFVLISRNRLQKERNLNMKSDGNWNLKTGLQK